MGYSPRGSFPPSDVLTAVLESAARLQRLVPDAVLVGGSAAALYAGHRDSFAHDHVLADLRDRFDTVLEALESEGDWVTNRVQPGKVILGRLGDIEAGVRQMIRTVPLEVVDHPVPSGGTVRVPTLEEALRVKGFLIVRRNQTRDYLDVVALAERLGGRRPGRSRRCWPPPARTASRSCSRTSSAAPVRPASRRSGQPWPRRCAA
jgi:hypothetical protein